MSVRAKFKVDSITTTESGGSVKLSPVTTGSSENKSFFKWTPWGNIEMGVMNKEALDQFQPGAEVYVDFTVAPSTSD